MQLIKYFGARSELRAFNKDNKDSGVMLDKGADSPKGKRWVFVFNLNTNPILKLSNKRYMRKNRFTRSTITNYEENQSTAILTKPKHKLFYKVGV